MATSNDFLDKSCSEFLQELCVLNMDKKGRLGLGGRGPWLVERNGKTLALGEAHAMG